jgi:hypothetical protein
MTMATVLLDGDILTVTVPAGKPPAAGTATIGMRPVTVA